MKLLLVQLRLETWEINFLLLHHSKCNFKLILIWLGTKNKNFKLNFSTTHDTLTWLGPLRVTFKGWYPGPWTFSIKRCLQSFKLQSPSSPLGPRSPWRPWGPLRPCVPIGPCFPLAPVAPGSPLSPLGPCCPGDPCCPAGPGIRLAFTIYRGGRFSYWFYSLLTNLSGILFTMRNETFSRRNNTLWPC